MNNDLSDLIVTLDSREKEQKRISSMRSFFEERGAVVDVGAISIKDGNQITSMDYSIEGSYKGKSVNLGVSAKSLVDFSGTIGNLSNELARAYLRFDEVGFVLITGCYETSLSNDSLHAIIRNIPAEAHNKDDRADILNTTSMFNMLSSWERSGVHCRQILYEEQFPQAVISILNFITKESHEGICFNTKGVADPEQKARMDFVNAHTHYGVSGVGVKTALKLWDYLIEWNYPPNLHFAASLSEEDLKEAVGDKTGKSLFEAYRSRHGWIGVKKVQDKANRSPLEQKLPETKGNIQEKQENAPNKKTIEFNNNNNNNLQSSTSITGVSHTETSSSDIHVTGMDDKLQSSSAEQELENRALTKNRMSAQYSSERGLVTDSEKQPDEENAKTDKINSSEKFGTLDILQSSEVAPNTSVDTAEGTVLKPNPIPTAPPSAVASSKKEIVKSLEDAIVDRVYDKPELDTVIMREFTMRGFQMPEIHKVIKESSRLHKYKQGGNLMVVYKGVKADVIMDVGV